MWRNYLTVGLRALAKNKTYAFINIFGLALGLTACLLILLFVRYETSYDSWMPGADRAFQLQDFYQATDSGGEEMKLQMTSFVNVVMSEAAVERLGYSASEAIGKQVGAGLTDSEYGLVPTTIVGVVKDPRFRSVRDPLQPIMFYYARTSTTR